MKYLIQTIGGEIKHDFSFHLIDAIRYQNWYAREEIHSIYLSDSETPAGYIPIGTVEFVTEYLEQHFKKTPKPINIPDELNTPQFTKRSVVHGSRDDIQGRKFVKSMERIKSFTEIVYDNTNVPQGRYIISDLIEIESEWRAFVYKGKLVGLNNYAGEFSMFPDVSSIQQMINAFKSQPIAFTLDVGVNDTGTFVIEVHDFFSCGLYGFSNARILPNMFADWFIEYTQK
jgi:hypothetical protein